MPLETCFTTISDWLRTDQSALPASHKLTRYFPQGPLDKDDGIDIVAVAEKPFRFFVYVPYNRNAQPVVIDVPRDTLVQNLCVQIRDDELLKDYEIGRAHV